MAPSSWHLQMLGAAQLAAPGQLGKPLERKAAALLAYLALEGPTRRSQLTELLWPETREAAARNNLVHLLRKLRQLTGSDLVPGAEVLTLDSGVTVDALEARDLFLRGEQSEFRRFRGEVLQGLTYDDCPELGDWVAVQRERWREWWAQADRAEARRLESEGRYEEALVLVAELLDLDPVSEEAWRSLMRLHYLRGDRPAALRAYHRCEEVLWRELGVKPLPETAELARQVERGRVPDAVPLTPAAPLPLAVLRPPVLIGREREWAQLEAAWQAGKVAYLQGAPGVGKTRLARDFAASKGAFIVNEGRPGDFRQPKSSSARAFQAEYARVRGIPVPDWVKREMSRYLPEFAEEGFEASPISDATDLLRFRQAMVDFYRMTTRDLQTHVIDDWQYFDLPSLEDGLYIFTSGALSGEDHRGAPLICTFREGELSAESEAVMREMVEGGHAVLIRLQSLGEAEAEQLLDTLQVPVSPAVRQDVSRYAGGNPLFLLETVKHLLETGQLEVGVPGRMLPPGRVRQLLERRLVRLSQPALQAARAAAVLQSDFNLDLVAQVLGAPLLDLLAAWEELEVTQIVHGPRFSHDLVYEAVLAGIPESVRELLHRRAARALAGEEAPPSRVARHWLEGGDHRQAATWFLRAAEAAEVGALFREAVAFYEQAVRSLEVCGQDQAARDIRARALTTPAALT